MIYVPRPTAKGFIPKSLLTEAAKLELAGARQHFRAAKTRLKAFKFEVYKKRDVKNALVKLFRGKCAYCECLLADQPGDVEHYRPKSEVIDGKIVLRPGYYWLASEWDNLLLSCRDCNGERMQEFGDEYRTGKSGKANYFPLLAGSRRWKYGKKNMESPVLLHPCRDNPSRYLVFKPSRPGVVLPKVIKGGNERGAETIRILGLNRSLLVSYRRMVISSLELSFEAVNDAYRRMKQNPNREAKQKFAERRKKLEALGAVDRPLAGMMQQIIKQFLGSLK